MYLLFSWRYFKAKKSTNAINVIAWISTLAIAVGAAALVLILSVFNGFEHLVKTLYSSFYTDLKVIPATGKVLVLTPEMLQRIRGTAGVATFSCVAEEKAILQNADYQSTQVFLKGVDDTYSDITGIKDHLIRGHFDLGNVDTPFLVMGSGVEAALGVLSDRTVYPVTAYLPRRGAEAGPDPLQAISEGNITPVGTFAIQQDFDDKYVITNIGTVKSLLGFGPDEYSALELKTSQPENLPGVQQRLQTLLGKEAVVQTRYEQNQGLYRVMSIEKWFIFAVLILILSVAAFNMVGALTMLVLEKQKDIQVLKALGAQDSFIRKIFLGEGMVLAGLGTMLGVGCALILCWAQVRYKLIPLQGGSFVIDYYPVKVLPSDIAIVVGSIFIVASLASWYPARKASHEKVDLRS
ncbi:FtsX-like permease family protein [Dinghuibacter silviterrae]|uniref:Lipoprotein-releasing system permease protein n=1 Tax=Dinghuibacter silviterrae TaxID=1539049 RepID=A0A4R8DQL1_9BACT|nr:FtsX-like permease family protein [Dinghuibacter silviterrae]TDW99410.1 lipoprotein-releasing system permease protein [Dinghuibacter silviterrae]